MPAGGLLSRGQRLTLPPSPCPVLKCSDWSRTIYARGRDEDYVILTRGALLVPLVLRIMGITAAASPESSWLLPLLLLLLCHVLPCVLHSTNSSLCTHHWAPAGPHQLLTDPLINSIHLETPAAGRLLDRIRVLLAGRAAEEIMQGSPSTYSNADLKVSAVVLLTLCDCGWLTFQQLLGKRSQASWLLAGRGRGRSRRSPSLPAAMEGSLSRRTRRISRPALLRLLWSPRRTPPPWQSV